MEDEFAQGQLGEGPDARRVHSGKVPQRIKVAVGEGGADEGQRGTNTRDLRCLPTVSKIGTCGVRGCVWIRSE